MEGRDCLEGLGDVADRVGNTGTRPWECSVLNNTPTCYGVRPSSLINLWALSPEMPVLVVLAWTEFHGRVKPARGKIRIPT